jgi:signal peptidase I
MNMNFQLILVILVGLSGLIYLLDVLFFAKKRNATDTQQKMPLFIDYARSFFPVLLLVLIVRSFLVQPFRVPSGSLEPTILPNDFVAVNQFAYGLRLPVIHTKILAIGRPKRGDVAVFRYPPNPKIDYVKRVIGLPGDRVVYKQKTLYINGKKMPQKFLRTGYDFAPPDFSIPANVKEETLGAVKHEIQVRQKGGDNNEFEVIVPEKSYFMMGDNRDDSADSRYFGFVPETSLIGKAFIIWFSWDSSTHRIRWNRMGQKL